jgi:hypothetical protein
MRPASKTGSRCYEGRPQRCRRSWTLVERSRVNELRASVVLELLRPIPEPGPDVPAEGRQRMERVDVGWQEWLVARDCAAPPVSRPQTRKWDELLVWLLQETP